MKPTKQTRRDAKRLLRLCSVDGLLDDSRARQLLQRVLQAHPRGCLPTLAYFERLLKLDYARHAATVETATLVPPDQSAAVQARLERAYGPGLNVSFVLTPALIGGMRVSVGSDVYDSSVQARLAALEERFL
jgi:F-type H+-transporting ATPase subunit delta